jgi:hypothetical protein
MNHPEPLDPFADDPDDPVHELEALDDPEDSEDASRTVMSQEDLLEELEEIELMEAALAPKGVRGLSMHCPDCDILHYFDWDLMRASARHIAEYGVPRVHEPAIDPDEDEYVPYSYARGYIDALLDAADDLEPAPDQRELS